MRSSRFLPLLALSGMFGAALLWAKMSGSSLLLPSPLPPTSVPIAVERPPYDPDLVRKTLEFYAAQTRYDPKSAIYQGLLAAQYLESYRESGDASDAARAESAARASLRLRTHNNAPAYFQLSRALLTQHRFTEALAAARKAAQRDPVGLRECADIEMEIGDYAAAARDLEAARRAVPVRVALGARNVAPSATPGDDPAFLALLSRQNELRGDWAGQLALLRRAARLADANLNLSVQSVAWFHERLGRGLGMTGRLEEAEISYQAALKVFPRDYRTMAAMAHSKAARGDWKGALEWGQKAAQIVPAPETLALLGDAYQARGQTARAQQQFRLVEKIGALSRSQGALYDRQRALFLADHGRNLKAAVALARGELQVRHDIYAYDTLAWTLYKTGDFVAAEQAMQRALARGTRDASLHFHAGLIAAAQQQNERARAHLQRALDINPRFHPTQPTQARAMLARLGAQRSSGK